MTIPADIAEIEDRHRRDIERLWSHRSEDVGKLGVHADRGTLLRAYRELEIELAQMKEDWRVICAASDAMPPDPHKEEIDRLRAELERLRGIKPELPPRPPDGQGLPRYGLRWNFRGEPASVPFADGYWTPWHLAQVQIERLRASNEKLQHALRDIYKSEGPDSLSLEDWQGLTLKLQRKAMAALADAQHPEQQPAQEQP